MRRCFANQPNGQYCKEKMKRIFLIVLVLFLIGVGAWITNQRMVYCRQAHPDLSQVQCFVIYILK